MSAVDVANGGKYSFLNNGDLVVEGGAIIYRNFAGQPTKFNPNGGKRTFALVIPQMVADQLIDRGWNVLKNCLILFLILLTDGSSIIADS